MKNRPLMPALMKVAMAFGAAAGVAAEQPLPAEVVRPPEIITEAALAEIAPHPRLLATADRWKSLRSQVKTDAVSRHFFELLITRADAIADLPLSEFKLDSNQLLRSARNQIVPLAAAYRLTGKPGYLTAARFRLAAVAAKPWPTGNFLDNALICIGVSLGYDWLYDDLTPAERSTLASALIEKSLRVTADRPTDYAFLWADHNWNQVCNSALALGALATAETDPELAAHVINRAIANIPKAAAAYAPDGVYPEGPGYWSFGTTQQVVFMDALRTALGTTADLEKASGLLASSDFIALTTGPGGDVFNFSDGGERRTFEAAMLWFARERRMPDLATPEIAFVREMHGALVNPQPGQKLPAGGIEIPFGLLWWDPALSATTPDSQPRRELPLSWAGQGPQPIAILRSSRDRFATWLAIKGGTPGYHHAHMDAGSFVLDADGVRWAVDPGIQPYPKVLAGGYAHSDLFGRTQESKRWLVFRNGPDAHNILRFNGAPQRVDGTAALLANFKSPGEPTAEIDLSPIYAGQVDSVTRRFTLRSDGGVTIVDEWATGNQPVAVTVQWLTRAKVTASPQGVRLQQDGKTLDLEILEGAEARVEVEDLSAPRDPAIDDANPKLSRIVIRLTTPANSTQRLALSATLEKTTNESQR